MRFQVGFDATDVDLEQRPGLHERFVLAYPVQYLLQVRGQFDVLGRGGLQLLPLFLHGLSERDQLLLERLQLLRDVVPVERRTLLSDPFTLVRG